ncbi:MAG TPA: SIS domain-containing protein [Roseiarcus sp.]|nr:SIS domain-containing protein [Roseiarcus sp.]
MDDAAWVADYVTKSAAAVEAFAADGAARAALLAMAEAIGAALRGGGKLLTAGNGGSAGDAQHIAGEFVVRLMYDRAPLAAMALTTDGSVMTAAGNDYGFERAFERQVRALGRPGDALLAISTSGNSPNILRALEAARAGGLATLGFGAGGGGAMAGLCEHLFLAPTVETALAQQIHIIAAHIVCGLVERAFFPREPAP